MHGVFNNPIAALVTLTGMEIVLGIDNIVFIVIVTSRLPVAQQPNARRIGLALALISRIILLSTLSWVVGMTEPVIQLSSLGFTGELLTEEVNDISVRDLILLVGGLFLIWKSVVEIHKKVNEMEHDEEGVTPAKTPSYGSVLVQIAILDIIFSLDSVITAVGMVDQLPIMITAVIIAVVVMLVFSESISRFVSTNPTLKMLALSFLILIGVMLVAEGIGTHVDKGYIYFSMAFALMVEFLNLRMKGKSTSKSSPANPAPNQTG